MRRPTLPLVVVSAAALAGGAAVYWRSESLRHAARARHAASGSEQAQRELAAATTRLAELEGQLDARGRELEASREQLARALAQVDATNALLGAERARLTTAREEFEARRERIRPPMPEGVRLMVLAFDACLAIEGCTHLRVLDARAFGEGALRGVEVLEAGVERRPSTLWLADELRLALDRNRGELELRFRGGSVVRDGVRRAIEPAGESIVLSTVAGEAWETRLPQLVAAVGEYPAVAAAREASERLDPLTMEAWRVRLEALLLGSGSGLRWRVGRFRKLSEARLVDVTIHGYGEDGLLAESASAKALAVEVDRAAGAVSLLLEDGVLRKPGGDTTIPPTGYRMLLPGVSPQAAIDAMLGLVVERR
ncbi:MAG: hypothetical protein IT457_17495 [Planctomycetes bacterium]|nr:hypothetical protein [Planctomycetota bacterium]